MKKNKSNAADCEILISRVINFPRERVWEAMTDPKQVVAWWGPRGFTTKIDQMDFKVGGTWQHVMRGPDGTEYPNQSTFIEINEPERIVYAHGGSKPGGPAISFTATWTFAELGPNQTRVTIRQTYPSSEERDVAGKTYGAIEGGKQCLIRLAEFVIRRGEPFLMERIFPQSIDEVWQAITDPKALEKWFFDFVGFQPEVGNAFSFLVEHEGQKFDHRCQITEIVSGRKIAYTWRYEGFPGDSLVTIELFKEPNGTRLKLTHEGLENFPPTPQFERQNFKKGWTSLIGEDLPKYLSSAPA